MNLMGCSEASKHTIELHLLLDMFSGSLLPIYMLFIPKETGVIAVP